MGFLTLGPLSKLAIKIGVTVLLSGLFGVALVRFAPGFGVDEEVLDSRLNNESIRSLHQVPTGGILSTYVDYLKNLMHGDLGFSRTLQRPASELIAERLPETLKTVGLGLALGWLLGFAMALAVVMCRAWYMDLAASLLVGILLCLPAAVLALLFVLVQAPARLLLALMILPKVFRYSRNLIGRSAALPHVVTARAKGLSETRVMIWHILPVAAPQLLALAGVTVSVAFTAAIPLEALCDIPGIGQLAWKAALGRDLQLLVNLTMIVTLVTLVANSLSDLVNEKFRTVAA